MARYDRQVADLIRLSDKRVPSALTPSQRERFSRFLYFAIEDGTGKMPATLLSLFSRMGMEPWDEAQALSKMPEHAAISRLAWLILSTMSNYTQANAELVAEHLLTLLPMTVVTTEPVGNQAMVIRRYLIVSTSALMFGWLVLIHEHHRTPVLEQDLTAPSSRHQADKRKAADVPPVVQPGR